MLKILIAADRVENWERLERILAKMDDCAIQRLESGEAIRERLLQGDVDVVFDDYEAYQDDVRSLSDFVRTFGLQTTVATLAEPKNYAAVFEDKNISINVCLLKPVRETTVLFYMQRVADRKVFGEKTPYVPTVNALLNRTLSLLQENFWRELLGGHMVQSELFLSQAARSVGMGELTTSETFLVLYVSGDNGRDWRFANHKEIFEFMAMALAVRESEGYAFYLADGVEAIVLQPYDRSLTRNRIILRCFQLCEEMERQFGYKGVCVMGEACRAADIPNQWRMLNERARALRFRKGRVFFLSDREGEVPMAPPPMERWGEYITSGKKQEILNAARRYFDESRDNPGLTADYIVSLSYELNRSVTIFLSEKGIYAAQDSRVLQLHQGCAASPEAFTAWLEALTDWCSEQERRKKESGTVLDGALEYIKKNISADLKRQSIADHVHVSQNYLARLFRIKLGVTVSDYIMAERMRSAERLLTKTKLPITEVAMHSGFTSQTYFSSCFKNTYGLSPREYRKKAES